jgi:hypothetical protein
MTAEVLDRWAECDAAAALPPGTQREPIEPPNISRELAKELHAMLSGRLEELEAASERGTDRDGRRSYWGARALCG